MGASHHLARLARQDRSSELCLGGGTGRGGGAIPFGFYSLVVHLFLPLSLYFCGVLVGRMLYTMFAAVEPRDAAGCCRVFNRNDH